MNVRNVRHPFTIPSTEVKAEKAVSVLNSCVTARQKATAIGWLKRIGMSHGSIISAMALAYMNEVEKKLSTEFVDKDDIKSLRANRDSSEEHFK